MPVCNRCTHQFEEEAGVQHFGLCLACVHVLSREGDNRTRRIFDDRIRLSGDIRIESYNSLASGDIRIRHSESIFDGHISSGRIVVSGASDGGAFTRRISVPPPPTPIEERVPDMRPIRRILMD